MSFVIPAESILRPVIFLIFMKDLAMSTCNLLHTLADVKVQSLELEEDNEAVIPGTINSDIPPNLEEHQKLISRRE